MSNQKFYTFNVTITGTMVVKADDETDAQVKAVNALHSLEIPMPPTVFYGVEQFDHGVEEITLVQTDPTEPKVYDDES